MTDLIVALDRRDNFRLAQKLREEAEVSWFKIGPQALEDLSLVKLIPSAKIFLDLKLYDTRETIAESVRRFDDYGIAALSLIDYEPITAVAIEAKGARAVKLWSVFWLSDDETASPTIADWIEATRDLRTDGVITPANNTYYLAKQVSKDIIAVGTRMGRDADGGHLEPTMPAEGSATYAVVGRPIWDAPDPVSRARAYIAALNGAKKIS